MAAVSRQGSGDNCPQYFYRHHRGDHRAGATPVFVDVDPQTSNISVTTEGIPEKNCFRMISLVKQSIHRAANLLEP